MLHPRIARFIATAENAGAVCDLDTHRGHFGTAAKVRLLMADGSVLGQANFDADSGADLGYWARRSGTIAGSNEVTRASLIARVRRYANA